jgi:hypothetical protein
MKIAVEERLYMAGNYYQQRNLQQPVQRPLEMDVR